MTSTEYFTSQVSTFISENEDILRLHSLSHQISLEDIMKNLPASIKEASFKSEDEFQADLKNFLHNSSSSNSEYQLWTSNYKEKDKTKESRIECRNCDTK